MQKTIITNSEVETKKLGEELAKKLKIGDVIALIGDLGSGKTTFTKGLAKGLGYRDRIISPTFTIERKHLLGNQRYFCHFDLYRLEELDKSTKELIKEALDDKNAIIVIEWAERIQEMLPKVTKKINFEYVEENKRRILIDG